MFMSFKRDNDKQGQKKKTSGTNEKLPFEEGEAACKSPQPKMRRRQSVANLQNPSGSGWSKMHARFARAHVDALNFTTQPPIRINFPPNTFQQFLPFLKASV